MVQAISSLAEAAYDAATDEMGEEEEPATFCLSSSFETIVSKLLATTERSDSGSNNLRSSAYEALMDMIKYCAKVSISNDVQFSSCVKNSLPRIAILWCKRPLWWLWRE